MIEGQVLNAQSAEELYQLKRDNITLRRQIDELTSRQLEQSNQATPAQSHSSPELIVSNEEELENLRQTIHRLTTVDNRHSLLKHSCRSLGKPLYAIDTPSGNRQSSRRIDLSENARCRSSSEYQ